MMNAVKRQCISHVDGAAALKEVLPSSVTEVEVEERAATGPPILRKTNSIQEELTLTDRLRKLDFCFTDVHILKVCETLYFGKTTQTFSIFILKCSKNVLCMIVRS